MAVHGKKLIVDVWPHRAAVGPGCGYGSAFNQQCVKELPAVETCSQTGNPAQGMDNGMCVVHSSAAVHVHRAQ